MAQDKTTLHAQIKQTRDQLREYVNDLRAVDDEIAALAPSRQQHELLEQACGSLERLHQLGKAGLFWGEQSDDVSVSAHLSGVRDRLESFHSELGALETRRQGIAATIGRTEASLEMLGEDLYDAEQEEVRREEEWAVEREIGPLPERATVMPWSHGGEDDARFRNVLALTMLVSIALGTLLPQIDLPIPRRGDPIVVPERLVQLVRQERAKPVPPPEPAVAPPEARPDPKPQETQPPEDKSPAEAPKPTAPAGAGPEPTYAASPPKQAGPGKAGLLAFRDTFASLAKDNIDPRLGSDARINDADDAAPAQVQRAMLTTNAPGSSGGINLASLSRNVGGGGGGGGGPGALAGVQAGRASSSIGGGGAGGGGGASDRPRAGGAAASRTDEEIQIVFDRYKAALYRLYNRELRKDPSLRGQMVLRLTIEPNGSVSMCALQSSDMDAPELTAQILDRVRAIDFGAKDVAAITIVYPIDFLPAA